MVKTNYTLRDNIFFTCQINQLIINDTLHIQTVVFVSFENNLKANPFDFSVLHSPTSVLGNR